MIKTLYLLQSQIVPDLKRMMIDRYTELYEICDSGRNDSDEADVVRDQLTCLYVAFEFYYLDNWQELEQEWCSEAMAIAHKNLRDRGIEPD